MADYLVFGRIQAAEHNPEPDAEPEPESEFCNAGHDGQQILDDDAGHGSAMIRDMIRGLDDSWVPDTTLLTRLSLAHSLNLYCNLSWSLQQWEHRFGTFSTSHPWGCDFWAGMNGLLAEYRFPPDSITLARAAHFKLPANFSKQAALHCPGPLNPPSGKTFPCFVWATMSDNGRMKYKVVCLWMLIMSSRGWIVDCGWISF